MSGERPPKGIRVFGQRSIHSSFFSRSSNPFKTSNENSQSKSSTLSDFLDSKLPETFVRPSTVKGKSTPFSSLRSPTHSNGSVNRQIGSYTESDSQTNSAIAKVIFEQFKRSAIDNGDRVVLDIAREEDISNADAIQDSRKRKKSIEGISKPRKNVVILGGDPKPDHKGKEEIRVRNKKPRPIYNHYANGSGWWGCDMEGIDSEEVGHGEVWEGVGSSTLGGIEWH